MSDKKHITWLRSQLSQWQARHIISESQAAEIDALYPEPNQANLARLIVSGIGAVLFGLGVILFFAYNWQDMPRYLKLTVIFTAFLASHAAALWCDSRHRAAGEGFALLGTVLFGSAIWLISQIYHIDEHYPNAYLAWGLAALSLAWARSSLWQGLAALILLSCWAGAEIFEFKQSTHIAPWIVLFGIGTLAWHLSSVWLLFAVNSVCLFLWAFGLEILIDEYLIYLILTASISLISAGFICERLRSDKAQRLRPAFTIPGFALYLGLIFILSFAESADTLLIHEHLPAQLQSRFYWSSLLVSLAGPVILFLPFTNWNKMREGARLHIVLLWVSVFLVFILARLSTLPDGAIAGAVNLVFIGHCLLFILHGSEKQRAWEVGCGCVLFAALVFARYTDLFESLLVRSLVFLILGACLFWVGNFYSRKKVKNKVQSEGATT